MGISLQAVIGGSIGHQRQFLLLKRRLDQAHNTAARKCFNGTLPSNLDQNITAYAAGVSEIGNCRWRCPDAV